MSGTRADIAYAEAAAAAAKVRMQETLARLKNRANPAVRARETWGDLRDRSEVLADDAIETAYERPRMIAGVLVAGLLFLLRKPLGRLATRLSRPARPKWDVQQHQGTIPTVRDTAGQGGDRR